jgi:hypothetical protein
MTYRPPKKPALALETEVVQDNMPAEVYPRIYMGSIHAAFNQEALLNMGITHVLFIYLFSHLSKSCHKFWLDTKCIPFTINISEIFYLPVH